MDDEVNTKGSQSKFSPIVIGAIILGICITCCVSMFINKIMFGNKIFKIDKEYEENECVNVEDIDKIDYTQTMLFNITPVFINSLVWIGVIMLILKKPGKKADTEE